MEIRIDKYSDGIVVVDPSTFTHKHCRLNSAMTKDLIKEEIKIRALSFRPIFNNRLRMEFSRAQRICKLVLSSRDYK